MIQARMAGGPFDGRYEVRIAGHTVVYAELIPPMDRPTDDTGLIFDDFGFVKYADPACNPTFRTHGYALIVCENGTFVGQYVGYRDSQR